MTRIFMRLPDGRQEWCEYANKLIIKIMFQPIGNLLGKSIKKSGAARQIEAAMVVEKAEEIIKEVLGKAVLKKFKVMYLKDNVLTIACLSSVLSQELKLNQAEIIKRLNNYFKKEVVEKLRFLS